MKTDRRDFLKITTVGATGLALTRTRPARAAWPSSGTMQINPNIDNMRVVAVYDTAMMKSVPSSMTFDTQNAAVDWPRVEANMDAMAMALAQKSSADEAWKTIFRSSRDWASTVVAVKVNAGEAKNTARLAVLRKFSNIFTGWGVKPENFIIYDYHTMSGGGQAAAATIFRSSFSTTDKSKVLGVISGTAGQSDDRLGGFKDGKMGNGATRKCPAKLVDGDVDILIDIANNKGHFMFGKVTLCMKNHYGTWEPDPDHNDLNNLIFNMNKGDPIIGGDPPRQQLCFVDSMFCNKANITGTPELMPCYFVMGTFAPAVDYLTVKKIREEVSKLSHDAATINSYLTAWGYKTSDPQWILVEPGSVTPQTGTGGSTGSGGGPGAGGANAGGRAAGSGGRRGAGGASGRSGSGGSSAEAVGGAGGQSSSASDGTSSGGSASGGESGSGGASAGGTTTSSASAAGGSSASGGSAKGTVAPGTDPGCACDVGGPRLPRGVGTALVVGAVVAGQLGRLVARRGEVAAAAQDPEAPAPATQPTEKT